MADGIFSCIREMTAPVHVKWLEYLKKSEASILSRLERVKTQSGTFTPVYGGGIVDFRLVDCCDETAMPQTTPLFSRTSQTRCYATRLDIKPCEWNLFHQNLASQFQMIMQSKYNSIYRGILRAMFQVIMDAVAVNTVSACDTTPNKSKDRTPTEDGVLKLPVSSALIGEGLFEEILKALIYNNALTSGDITLIVPRAVAFLLQQASFERHKYCCNRPNLGSNVDNLLSFTVEYEGINFYIYAENKSIFTLKNDGTHTLGMAFVNNRMAFHYTDGYKSIFEHGCCNTMVNTGFDDIVATTIDSRPSGSFVPAIIMSGAHMQAVRMVEKAGLILEFTNAEIYDKTINNNLTLTASPTAVPFVATANDVPEVVDNGIVNTSATFNDIAQNKKTKQ